MHERCLLVIGQVQEEESREAGIFSEILKPTATNQPINSEGGIQGGKATHNEKIKERKVFRIPEYLLDWISVRMQKRFHSPLQWLLII